MSKVPITEAGSLTGCPACGCPADAKPAERFGKYSRYACAGCDLHYWHPRALPDAAWYEQIYGGRDRKLLPLEPGHKYFLSDKNSPGSGQLLDLGCGTGNFLVAAQHAGYQVTGTELDAVAAKFAMQQIQPAVVHSLTAAQFAQRHTGMKFDVVTFFEVLEHQADPVEFIAAVRKLVRDGGFIALSVPNRLRWLTGPDVFDYPPNHFLRWSSTALTKFLCKHGFETLSLREQAATLQHSAVMLNLALRTGVSKRVGAATPSFREVMQMEPAEAAAVLEAKPGARTRAIQWMGRAKALACYPLAAIAYPYIRLRRLKSTYLYCLARLAA